MTRQGKCKYCGQIAMIDCPESFTQEEVDEEASKKCSCPEAQAASLKEYNRTSAAAFIKDAFKNDQYMQDFMPVVVDAVMDEAADKVQVVQKTAISAKTVETKTYTMSLNNEGRLIINMKQAYASKEKF